MSYLVFYKKNQRVIAIPMYGAFTISINSINCWPSHTLKRKFFKLYMYCVTSISYFSKWKQDDKKDIFENCINECFDLIHTHSNLDLYPLCIWSLVEGRRRYYIHALDVKGERKIFAKVSAKKDDFPLLENEKNCLSRLSLENQIRTPKVIKFKLTNDCCCLLTTYMDKGYSLYHPDSNSLPVGVLELIKGSIRVEQLSDVLASQWWAAVCKKFNKNLDLIKNVQSKALTVKVKKSFVHGDFGSENIFQNGEGGFYVIDWERGESNAPYLTDNIAYWLGKNHALIKSSPNSSLKKFDKAFQKYNDLDVTLGLLFLMNLNFDLAEILGTLPQNNNMNKDSL